LAPAYPRARGGGRGRVVGTGRRWTAPGDRGGRGSGDTLRLVPLLRGRRPQFVRAAAILREPAPPRGATAIRRAPESPPAPRSGRMVSGATAVLEPLGVAIHAIDLGHLTVGDAVAVFGCGPIGLMIARVAHLAGARLVCATEPLPHRRAAATRFGASTTLDPAAVDVVREIKSRTKRVRRGRGV